MKLPYEIYAGLPPTRQSDYIEAIIPDEARELIKLIKADIAVLGGPKLTADIIMLENLNIYGFNNAPAYKARIRSRQDCFEKSKNWTPADTTWKQAEIDFLISNKNLIARIVGRYINRTVHAVHRKRYELRKKGVDC